MPPVPGQSRPPVPAGDTHRLPRTVDPLAYRIEIAPELGLALFSGTEEIDVMVREQTAEIVLNAADLEIGRVTVTRPGGEEVVAEAELDAPAERVVLRLPEPIEEGHATLRLDFGGALSDSLRGFYRSTFTGADGAPRTIATTQMEATDARRAFPCWDEPDRKATFETTLVVDEGLAAFSNAPVESEEPVAGPDGARKRRVRFRPTMKMSTYLVALIVGPLEATAPVDVNGVPVRVVHVPGKAHLAHFALEVAAHALEFFEGYFGIPYPGQKLDLVAIPDFAFGAMENVGCVTFRESALLVDPGAAARVELERIADVVHHEIAHMWFGDLVTMSWWEGIWLNEAFATFMELLATDHYRPDWQRWLTFGLERDGALGVDSLHATRPIEYPVVSPEDADGMFDTLTYEKGASVLRMIEQFLGADVFRDGIRRYLEDHAYSNTVTADLWDALEAVSGQPVRTMAETWIHQGGHPLVTFGDTSIDQEPFSYLPEAPRGESAIGTRWIVPVLLRELEVGAVPAAPGAAAVSSNGAAADAGARRLLLAGSAAAGDHGAEVANAGGWGAYRVAYAPARRRALVEHLGALDALERFGVVADTWALVLAGRTGMDALLALGERLGPDEDPAPYSVVAAALRLCERVSAEPDRRDVQAAARALLGPRAATLGWEARADESPRIPTLRALLIGALGTVGADEDVRREAGRRFDERRRGGPAIDADIEAAVLTVVASEARADDYDTVLDRYRHAATPQEERRHLMALGAFADTGLSTRTFELAMTEVRRQDGPHLVNALLANRAGGATVWGLVTEHWDEILERFAVVSHARMLANVVWLCADPAFAADVEDFLVGHPLAVGERTVAQALERLRVHVAFGRRLRADGGLTEAMRRARDG